MICPVCKTGMIGIEHNRIELDYCVKCRGVWFDEDELELLFESLNIKNQCLSLTELLKNIDNTCTERRYRCPICRPNMTKVKIGDNPHILIDVCANGDGIWFDGGEAVQLIKQTSRSNSRDTNSEQQVIDFLGEVFRA
jgi:Zn-finger nucleic acid-binding protein